MINIVSSRVHLKPYEKKAETFILNSAAPVLRTDLILVSPLIIGTVRIFPSKTELLYDEKLNTYKCTVVVANTSNKETNMLVIGSFEILNGQKTIRIHPSNYSILKETLKENSLGREILPSIDSQKTDVPIFSISRSEMKTPKSMNINDIDSEALFSKNPSYMGEAEINDKSFEPCGIEVPTKCREGYSIGKFSPCS